MALTVDRLIVLFPELAEADLIKAEGLVTQLAIETNSYSGLPEAKAELALALHVAHYLEVDRQLAGVTAPGASAGNVKRVQSNNDELEYFDRQDRYRLENTSYGARLQDLLASSYHGGFFLTSSLT